MPRSKRGSHDRKLFARGRSGEGSEPQIASPRPYAATGNKLLVRGRSKEDAGASQSGARLPQGLLPLRSLRFGDAIGLFPFTPSRRKRGRGGHKSSICEEFPSTNFSPSIPTWANVERREKSPPRRQISTHISPIFVPRQDVFSEARIANRSLAPRLKNF